MVGGYPTYCRFTTYRHRFARAALALRAKRGRASPVNQLIVRSFTSLTSEGASKIEDAAYPSCCPLVCFSHIGSILDAARDGLRAHSKDAARDGPCAHGKQSSEAGGLIAKP